MENYVEIILADDNIEEGSLTIRALQRNNLASSVLHLTDGEEVIEYIRSNPAQKPRLILLDVKMPKVDGIEVLRYLKTDREWKNIPAVMFTSSGEEKDVAESYTLGANGYVVKPVSTDSFRSAIEGIGIFWMKLNKPTN